MELNAAYSKELLKGGGSNTSDVNKKKWYGFGGTYGQQSRNYRGKKFLYSTPKNNGAGLYQPFSTKIGKTYTVSAILIGTDTNRKKRFNGTSYLTISSQRPRNNGAYVIAESSKISGSKEREVKFSFTARSRTYYIALRSNQRYKYANGRAISIKEGSVSNTTNRSTSKRKVETNSVTTPVVSTFSGRKVSLTSSKPIVVKSSNTVIENKVFRGNGRNVAIKINGKSNVTVRNCLFINFKEAIFINKSSNIKVKGNRFENGFTSIRALRSSNIYVTKNEALNVGHTSVGPRANFVTFDTIQGGKIQDNRVENEAGKSNYVEDIISIYKSHGRRGNPILVERNWLRGQGPSHSGSCIMAGDNSGTFTVARNNIGVDCGQVGMGIAGGSNNEISNNILVHTKTRFFSSLGVYASAFRGHGGRNNIIKNNKVNWWSSASRVYFGSSINKSLHVILSGNRGFGWKGRDTSINSSVLPKNLFKTSDRAYFSGRNR